MKKYLILVLAGIIFFSACQTNAENAKELSTDEFAAYTYLDFDEKGGRILLATENTYGDAVAKASFLCDAYYESGGQRKYLGEIISRHGAGTSYSLKLDGESILAAHHHNVERYVIDHDEQALILAEYAFETFDAEGNGTFTYFQISDGKEIVTNDPQFYNDLYAKYLNAEMIDFQ